MCGHRPHLCVGTDGRGLTAALQSNIQSQSNERPSQVTSASSHFWTYNLAPRLDCFNQLWTATFRSYLATGLSVAIVERRPCIHSKRKLCVVQSLNNRTNCKGDENTGNRGVSISGSEKDAPEPHPIACSPQVGNRSKLNHRYCNPSRHPNLLQQWRRHRQ